MHDVFISYSSKNKNVADAVVANFEQNGIKCWYAPRDILPGEEWVSAIREGLNIATIFVLIYTDESNKSRQVMNEVALAFNAGKTIIPFRLTESFMNNELEYYLTRVHWLDAVTETLENSINKLREYVAFVLGKTTGEIPVLHTAENTSSISAQGTAAQTPVEEIHEKKGDKKKLTKKIAVPAALVALIVVIVGIIILVGKGSDKKGKSENYKTGLEMYYSESANLDNIEKEKTYFKKAAEKGEADAYYYLGRLDSKVNDYQAAVTNYEKGIEAGSALAKVGLADMYLNGHGISTDISKANRLYNEALSEGAEEANLGLGIICWKGMSGNDEEVDPDAAKALEYFERAAETSKDKEVSGYSYIYMGEVYRLGTGGVAADMSTAEIYYIKAFEKLPYLEGEAKYLAGIGFDMADDKIHSDRYFAESKTALDKYAAEGDVSSLEYLGDIYRFGYGVEADGVAAYSEYYKKAADMGSAEAMYRIGMMYINGDGGLTINYDEAYEWLSKAAALGDGQSMKAIGDLYYFKDFGLKDDGEKNYEKAIYYYEEATRAGNGKAYIVLSEMYKMGRGFEKNLDKTRDNLFAAIRLGESDALYWLGVYYLDYAKDGSEEENHDKAMGYFRSAAESGSPEALNYMGMIYANGTDFAEGMEEEERLKLAEQYLIASAQTGKNINALTNLGFLYWKKAYSCENEDDKENYFEKAFTYYNKAVNKGSVHAKTEIGKMYLFGNIGKLQDGQPDYYEATKWFQQAEEGNDAEAMYYIAMEYLYGTGSLAQSTDDAYEKALAAFEGGYKNAVDLLLEAAERYCNDDFEYSIASEYDKALVIYNKLLESGVENSRMYYRLGSIYYFGLSVDKDYAAAVSYMEKALEKGFSDEEADWIYGALIQIYYDGAEGVGADMTKAAKYAEEGAEFGRGKALIGMSFLYKDGYYSDNQAVNAKKCMQYQLEGAEFYANKDDSGESYSAVLDLIRENIETGYFDSGVLRECIEEKKSDGSIGDKTAADALNLIGD